jgi:hypothetical protein
MDNHLQIPQHIGETQLSMVCGVKSTPSGPLLILERNNWVWLARGGIRPLAWKRRPSQKAPKWNPWKYARPPVDELLRPQEIYVKSIEALKAELKSSLVQEAALSLFAKYVAPAVPSLNRPVVDSASKVKLGRIVRGFCRSRRISAGSLEAMNFALKAKALTDHHPVADAGFSSALRRSALIREGLRNYNKLKAVASWAATFDCAALSFLERHGFTERRWHLLNLFVRVPEGRELFEDFPQLAFLLANSWLLRNKPVKWPLRSIRSLVHKPRRAILAWLDLPPGDGTLHVLRRLSPGQLNGIGVWRLRMALLPAEKRSWVFNLKGQTLSSETLGVLAFAERISFRILQAIANGERINDNPDSMTVFQVHKDIHRMLEQLIDRPDGGRVLERINSKSRLWAFHEQLVAEMRQLDVIDPRILDKWRSPIDPPLKPSPGSFITPIRTIEELVEEARLMHHCVDAYASLIANQQYYVYRVNHQQGRATLGVRLQSSRWCFAELRGTRNESVPDAVRADVMSWLEEADQPVLDEDDLPF